MAPRQHSKNNIQLFWGAALVLMGVAVFFRLQQVMPKLAEMGLSDFAIGFFRVCLYIIGFVLVGGGVRKWIQHFNPDKESSGNTRSDSSED
ncbi:MAG: hypothetical protein P8X96_10540 [Desulfobacteraceae bacterium]|jgi:uncharacterized membrane protein HdeD (DUF308 family)